MSTFNFYSFLFLLFPFLTASECLVILLKLFWSLTISIIECPYVISFPHLLFSFLTVFVSDSFSFIHSLILFPIITTQIASVSNRFRYWNFVLSRSRSNWFRSWTFPIHHIYINNRFFKILFSATERSKKHFPVVDYICIWNFKVILQCILVYGLCLYARTWVQSLNFCTCVCACVCVYACAYASTSVYVHTLLSCTNADCACM